ncbi:MAG: lytic transglycosylase domain-containing protein [Syntrophorhabdaceae bacterium]|nr:lytic transglycosylase domain-containing protein [Syntrophorhabdaceae bacterium]MDD4197178.1 lytic transglycosylase domain-containing protein [Syntrophorhabdaceae bacterium]
MKPVRFKFLSAMVKPGRFFIVLAIACCFMALALTGATKLQAQSPSKKNTTPADKRIGDLEKDVMRLQRQADLFNLDALPDNLVLCDKKIPIFQRDNRERFEREFFQLLEDRGLLTIVIKRYYKYLPMITDEIARAEVPSDLIYLAVTESYLNPRAVSRSNAGGMWQFMKETGKMEGLTVNDCIDERFNMKKATRSALIHLKKLNGQFNDWLLAMAAYNAGPGRIREAIQNQMTRDFFDMYLPEETERYIFRILALKEIIANRDRYGLHVDDREMYRPVLISEVIVESNREFDSCILANAMDVSYRTYRMNNLHLRKYKLPKGVYRVNVPMEKKDSFVKKMRSYNFIQCQ